MRGRVRRHGRGWTYIVDAGGDPGTYRRNAVARSRPAKKYQEYRRSGTAGYAAQLTDTLERLTGQAPRSLD